MAVNTVKLDATYYLRLRRLQHARLEAGQDVSLKDLLQHGIDLLEQQAQEESQVP